MVAEIVRVVGIHLLQSLDLVESPRRSAVARLDDAGRLEALALADGDDEVLGRGAGRGRVGRGRRPRPCRTPEGSRDAERVLAWCDVPGLPRPARRLERVFGGARGGLAPALLRRPGRSSSRRSPTWCCASSSGSGSTPPARPPSTSPTTGPAWLGVRARAYRPQGRGAGPARRMARAHEPAVGGPRPGRLGPGSRTATTGARCTMPPAWTPSAAPTRRCGSARGRGAATVGHPRLGTGLLPRRREPPRARGAHCEAARLRGMVAPAA